MSRSASWRWPAFPLREDLHTLGIDHVEQFQRGATRALRANFPILHRRGAGVEDRRKHRLTHAGARPNRPDLPGRQRTDWRYGEHIKLPHRLLIEDANAVQSAGGLVHLSEDSTFL